MNTAIDPEFHRRNFRTVIGLGALFLVPLAVAFWLYYGLHWRPQGMTNHGKLLLPVRTLPDVTLPDADGVAQAHIFQGKWTLVYVGNGACDEKCRTALFFMRQTRLSLGHDMTRVQRVFLVTADCCDRAYLTTVQEGLRLLDASQPAAQPLLSRFTPDGRTEALYVVDPLGNLVMRYDASMPPKGLLDDLKHLLQLSSIG